MGKHNIVLHGERKVRYKMYKSGKRMVYASLFSLAIGGALLASNVEANASTTANTDQTTTTAENSGTSSYYAYQSTVANNQSTTPVTSDTYGYSIKQAVPQATTTTAATTDTQDLTSTKGSSLNNGAGAALNIKVGQNVSVDNSTTPDSTSSTVEKNTLPVTSTDTTNHQSNLNADGAITVKNTDNTATTPATTHDVTLTVQQKGGINVTLGGDNNEQVVVELPTALTDKVQLGNYDTVSLNQTMGGNWQKNQSQNKIILDPSGNFAVDNDTKKGQFKVTLNLTPTALQGLTTTASNALQGVSSQLINALNSLQSAINGAVDALSNPLGAANNSIVSILKSLGINVGSLQQTADANIQLNLGDANTPGTVIGDLTQAASDLSINNLTQLTTIVNASVQTDSQGRQYLVSDNFAGSAADAINTAISNALNSAINSINDIHMSFTPLATPSTSFNGDILGTVSNIYTAGVNGIINSVMSSVQTMINSNNADTSWNANISQVTSQVNSVLGHIPFIGGTLAYAINSSLQAVVNAVTQPLRSAGYFFHQAIETARNFATQGLSAVSSVENAIGNVKIDATTTVEVPMKVANPDLSQYTPGSIVDEQFGATITNDKNFANAIANQSAIDTTSLKFENVDSATLTSVISAVQTGSSDYNLPATSPLAEGIAAAQSVLGEAKPTQADLNVALNNLVSAYQQFQSVTGQTVTSLPTAPSTTTNDLVVVPSDLSALSDTTNTTSKYSASEDFFGQGLSDADKTLGESFAQTFANIFKVPDSNSTANSQFESVASAAGLDQNTILKLETALSTPEVWDMIMASPLQGISNAAAFVTGDATNNPISAFTTVFDQMADSSNPLLGTVQNLAKAALNAASSVATGVVGGALWDQPADQVVTALKEKDGSTATLNTDYVKTFLSGNMANRTWEQATSIGENRRQIIDLNKIFKPLQGTVTLPDDFLGNIGGDFFNGSMSMPKPATILADAITRLLGISTNGFPVDSATGYEAGYDSGNQFLTLNSLIGSFTAGLTGETTDKALDMHSKMNYQSIGNANAMNNFFTSLGSFAALVMNADFPDPLTWAHDTITQFIKSMTPDSTDAGPGVSATSVPTTQEFNTNFMTNADMMAEGMDFISGVSVNNVAHFILNEVSALIGSVIRVPLSLVNGFVDPGAVSTGTNGILPLAGQLGTSAFNGVTDTIGEILNGLILTLNGEIDAPILSDEPDRLVFGSLAGAVTDINSFLHDVLGDVDALVSGNTANGSNILSAAISALSGVATAQTMAAQMPGNNTTIGHRVMGLLSAGLDSITDLIWNIIITPLNLLQLIHPHGYQNIV